MKRTLFFVCFFVSSVYGLNAQTIKLHFPHFVGKPHAFVLYYGDRADTIARGIIPSDARVVISIPPKYKGYRGIGRWVLTDKTGGGFDMVVNSENFSVECLDVKPNERTIKFIDSKENAYLGAQRQEQQRIFMQLNNASRNSTSVSPLFPSNDVSKLEQQFDNARAAMSKSDFFAAQYMRFTGYTQGVADKTYRSEFQLATLFDRYITEQIDWQALYNSNYWSVVIRSWVQMHLAVIKNDQTLLANTRKMFARMPNNDLYTEFAAIVVRIFTETAKDALVAELSGEVKRSGRLLRTDGLLIAYTGIQKGDKAPEIIGLNNSSKAGKGGRIILFFESDCGHCEALIKKINEHKDLLKQKDVQVVSIASDVSPEIYAKAKDLLTWNDKLCDFKGTIGPNYKSYGIVGTPTVFYVDTNGIVQGRFALFEDVLALIK